MVNFVNKANVFTDRKWEQSKVKVLQHRSLRRKNQQCLRANWILDTLFLYYQNSQNSQFLVESAHSFKKLLYFSQCFISALGFEAQLLVFKKHGVSVFLALLVWWSERQHFFGVWSNEDPMYTQIGLCGVFLTFFNPPTRYTQYSFLMSTCEM